ncbi:NUDIX hydrolase [Flagellimonas sp. S174]|uniref:NUDIX hydrolase n=1 Tax=Flagellimonas sp. S174 TaxID=3410790 RepID=UPI003BF6166E
MDELVDILDTEGNLTGQSLLKSEAHRLGLYHSTVHVWCYDEKGFVLLQQRGKNKINFPLMWDISVAGHVSAGETLEVAAIREVREEIGIAIVEDQLKKIGVFKTEHLHAKDFLDREFNYTFLCHLSRYTPLQKQDSEVEALEWFPLERFKQWVEKKHPDLVPNLNQRYEKVITEIESRL